MGRFKQQKLVNIGGFDLVQLGSISQAEEEWLEQFYTDQNNLVTKPALQLHQHLVKVEGMSEEAAADFIGSLDKMAPARQMAVMARYQEIIPEVIDGLSQAPRIQNQATKHICTWVLSNRLPQGWQSDLRQDLIEDFGIDPAGVSEWQPGWTDMLPVTTINAIYDFIIQERSAMAAIVADVIGETNQPEELSVGEDSTPSSNGDPPTGGNDTQSSKPLALVTPSTNGKTGQTAPVN